MKNKQTPLHTRRANKGAGMKDNKPLARAFDIIGFSLFGVAAGVIIAQSRGGLDECRAKIPRDQICVLIAVPENSLANGNMIQSPDGN